MNSVLLALDMHSEDHISFAMCVCVCACAYVCVRTLVQACLHVCVQIVRIVHVCIFLFFVVFCHICTCRFHNIDTNGFITVHKNYLKFLVKNPSFISCGVIWLLRMPLTTLKIQKTDTVKPHYNDHLWDSIHWLYRGDLLTG